MSWGKLVNIKLKLLLEKASFLWFFILLFLHQALVSQVVTNEVASANCNGIPDENEDMSDWIEIYNRSNEIINPEGYSLKDDLQDTIYFSSPGGQIKSETIDLELTSDELDVQIYFTTDCTNPDTSDFLYSSPIHLDTTTVIKAAAFLNGVQSGEVFTSTYLFKSAHTLPLISLSTDPVHLFDYYQGILVLGPNAEEKKPHFGANFWQDWEKPIHFEYYDEDGNLQINQLAGTKVFGNFSRAREQKSMSLFARKKYGKGSFQYKFFKDREFEKFESIILRNSGNDSQNSHFRDALSSEVAKTMDIDREAYQPCVIYLNGEYWGILNMREKLNEHYIESHHGVKEEDLILFDPPKFPIIGDPNEYFKLEEFFKNANLTSDEAYQQAKILIDIESFIDYNLMNIYIANTDWPGNNSKCWKSINPESPWRWIMYDTDFGFSPWNKHSETHNTLAFATDSTQKTWPNPAWSTVMLRKLLSNDEFQKQFLNRFVELMNTSLSEERLLNKLDSIVGLLEGEMHQHMPRWNRSFDNWQNQVASINNFIKKREEYLWRYFEEYFHLPGHNFVHISVSDEAAGRVLINNKLFNTYPIYRTYFNNIPLNIRAIPRIGYRFTEWKIDSNSNSATLMLTPKDMVYLHAVFEPDSNYKYDVVINEINYWSGEGHKMNDWIELYNTGDQDINLRGWQLSDGNTENDFTFSDSLPLLSGEYLVVCENEESFGKVYPLVNNKTGDFAFGLNTEGDIIRLTDNNFNLVDEVRYHNTIPWPTENMNSTNTLELINPGLDNNDGNSWNAGFRGGSPGSQNDMFVGTSNDVYREYYRIKCYPSVFSDFTTLHLYSPGNGAVNIRIFDPDGHLLQNIDHVHLTKGSHYFDIFVPQEKFGNGMYIVQVKTERNIETLKVVKQQ